MEVRRTCSVQAQTVCEINILLQRTFDDILREHPDFAKRMNELVVARQLETSIARAAGSGAMKIRQTDLNYANMAVAKTMQVGLNRRATAARGGERSIRDKEIFPEDFGQAGGENSVEEPVGELPDLPELPGDSDDDDDTMVEIPLPFRGKEGSSDDQLTPSSKGRHLGGGILSKIESAVPALAHIHDKVSHVGAHASPESPAKKSITDENSNNAIGEEGSGSGGGGGETPSRERESSMNNIFDQIERKRSVNHPTHAPIAATKGAFRERKPSEITGSYSHGEHVDLGKVHGSILMGGDNGRGEVGSPKGEIGRIRNRSFHDGSSSGGDNGGAIKQLHHRMSNTERMLEALLTKFDIQMEVENIKREQPTVSETAKKVASSTILEGENESFSSKQD